MKARVPDQARPTDAAPVLSLAVFRADVTPPKGEVAGLSTGWIPRIETIEHPLEARGVILRHGDQVFVLAALDFCVIPGPTHDLFRRRLAEAAGISPERVAIQVVHQHTAPVLDADAAKLAMPPGDSLLEGHLRYIESVASRMAVAVKAACGEMTLVTRVVGSKAKVERVASNRRVPRSDGTLAGRMSSTKDATLRNAPEGLIDPWVRTVTFFHGQKALAQAHYYATHPQSFYQDARVSWDVPGIARERMERESGVFQVYFTGCAGNVAMGKYNTGTREERSALADRLFEAMRSSERGGPAAEAVAVEMRPDVPVLWTSRPLGFAPRDDEGFREEPLRASLARQELTHLQRIRVCRRLTSIAYLKSGRPLEASRLRIGPIQLVQLPGEPFVEFQLFAQKVATSSFVCVAGYGNGAPSYYGPNTIYQDKGGYEQTAALCGPCQHRVEEALSELLAEGASKPTRDAVRFPERR